MATLPCNTLEICIRIDRDTLRVDAAKVTLRLVQMLRRRFRADVTGTAVIFPPASDAVVISRTLRDGCDGQVSHARREPPAYSDAWHCLEFPA